MGATEVAILAIDFHVKLHACATKQLESLYLGQSIAIQREQGEAHLEDDVLHGVIGGKEDDMAGSALSNIDRMAFLGGSLLCLIFALRFSCAG